MYKSTLLSHIQIFLSNNSKKIELLRKSLVRDKLLKIRRLKKKSQHFFKMKKKTSWQEDEFEAWKKLQEQTKMDFNPEEKTEE